MDQLAEDIDRQLILRREDQVAVVTMGTSNAVMLDTSFCLELDSLLADLEAEDAVQIIVLAGGIPGLFLPKFSRPEMIEIAESLRANPRTMSDDDEPIEFCLDLICRRVWNSRKLVIAAINGDCLGGAYEFAASCDYRIMERGDYLVGLHEARGGIFPGAGGTQRLPRIVGPALAFRLLINGEKLSPEDAEACQMVHESVEGSAVERAVSLAREWLARGNPGALADLKHLVQLAIYTPLAEGLRVERNRFSNHLASDWNYRRITQTAQEER